MEQSGKILSEKQIWKRTLNTGKVTTIPGHAEAQLKSPNKPVVSVMHLSVQKHFLIIGVRFSVETRGRTLFRLCCRTAADSRVCIPGWFSCRLFRCRELEELFSVT